MAPAQPRERVARGVVGVDPLEAAGVVVALPQGRRVAIDAVEVGDALLHATVVGVVELPPVETACLAPLGVLRELRSHEQQLLARVRPHEGEVRAQVGELLPVVSRHLADERALSVHDLVVADRQAVLLAPRVHQRERHLAVVPLPVHRLARDVVQRVVHPAHVPLEAESQTAEVRGSRDARPRGRLLGDHDDAGGALVRRGIGLLDEGDCLEVLAPAVHVGAPLAVLARVVEVEHRGDSIDAQAVDVELLEPVRRVGDEEVAHLAAPEVEHVGAPVGLLAAAGVGVLVERGAVEARQRPLVLGEVRRHPVEDDADARLVEPVDEVTELVGGPEARGWCVVRRDLVAPARRVGVLGDRHQLDVGEAELADVGRQLVGELGVGETRAPRPEMHLVGRHRGVVRVSRATSVEPLVVGPLIGGGVDH